MTDQLQNISRIEKGKTIFEKGMPVFQIAMIVQGGVLTNVGGARIVSRAGEIIGISDAYAGVYQSDYVAAADSIIFLIPASDETSLNAFLSSNDEYRGIAVYSLTKQFIQHYKIQKKLHFGVQNSYDHLMQHFNDLRKKGQIRGADPLSGVFIEQIDDDDENEYNYYLESGSVGLDEQKSYYRVSEYMASYQVEKLNGLIGNIISESSILRKQMRYLFELLYNENGEGLLQRECDYVKDRAAEGITKPELVLTVDETKSVIQELYDIMAAVDKKPSGFSLERVEKLTDEIKQLCHGASGQESAEDAADDEQIDFDTFYDELQGSLDKILSYAGMDEDKTDSIKDMINNFVSASDRMSTTDDMRRLKKQIQGVYFDLYEAVIKKWLKDRNNAPVSVKLFLYLGFWDERLVNDDQLRSLCEYYEKLKNRSQHENIYYMPEWLEAIYRGEKEPSRNSFEQDYPDYLRDLKKRGEIRAEQEQQLLNDYDNRLSYEIHNMFEQTNKICNGQISTYVPVLYEDQIFANLMKQAVTPAKIKDAMLEVEDIDVTAFYRETTYTNEELNIQREQVMKKMYPDFIILPVYGSSASMWQEISGKRRFSPARILFPAFEESELLKLMTQQMGRLRWEYVRREMGGDWNNIQVRSLTSEYSDYVQYYRKNRDLSDDMKEKVKNQLSKARNSFREVFVQDYINWIEYESKGAMKLNRVSREILATYLPFSKERRDSLRTNAMFEKAMKRQEMHYGEIRHTWELKIRKRENHGDEVPKEFYTTYRFYDGE